TAEGVAEKARAEIADLHRQLKRNAYTDRVSLAQTEWQSGRYQHARELLREAESLQADLSEGPPGGELGYLRRLIHPEVAELAGHTNNVLRLTYSPNGRRLLTACQDGIPRLWEVPSGKLIAAFPKHGYAVVAEQFSPDGRQLQTVGSDGMVRLWDGETG